MQKVTSTRSRTKFYHISIYCFGTTVEGLDDFPALLNFWRITWRIVLSFSSGNKLETQSEKNEWSYRIHIGFKWLDKPSNIVRISRVLFPIAIADAPARAMLLNFMQFNGSYGCHYCEHPGASQVSKQTNQDSSVSSVSTDFALDWFSVALWWKTVRTTLYMESYGNLWFDCLLTWLAPADDDTVNIQPYYQATFQSDSDVFSEDRSLQFTVS